MKTKLLRALGIYLLLDGQYARLVSTFGWTAEAAFGLAVLRQAPLDVQTVYRNVADGYTTIDPGYR